MTYEQAMEYCDQTAKRGSVLGLGPMTELLQRLNHPEDQQKIIHVAGTNGKGSTCAYLASILAAAGYRVGRYNSPAVFEIHENISVMEALDSCATESIDTLTSNGVDTPFEAKAVTKEEFAQVITQVKAVCDQMEAEKEPLPTVFEIETAAALLFFKEKDCDFVLLEVGMGGRLDATNAIRSKLCSVLASISRDHWQFLGDTIGKIASEKAGIVAEHGLVISTRQPDEAMQVIEQECKKKDAKLWISDYSKVHEISHSLDGITFTYHDFLGELKVRLLGVHQIQNAALAIDTALVIRELGYAISKDAIRVGLVHAVWHGRLERIGQYPDFFIDGAHNEGAAQALADSIQQYLAGRQLIFIIGIFADKDYHTVLHKVLPYGKEAIAIQPNNKRALPSEQLTAAIHEEYPQIKVYDAHDAAHAVAKARKLAEPEDVILAFGSLSFLKDIVVADQQ